MSVKIVYLVQKRPDLGDAEFVEHWMTTHAGLARHMPGLLAYSINIPSSEQRGPRPLDGYAMLKFPDWATAKAAWNTPEGRATAADGTLFMAGAKALIVEEHKIIESAGPQAQIKIVYLVQKRPDLGDAEFVEHWMTTHAGLAWHMPGLLAYSINIPSSEQRGPRPLDGYAMLKFPDWATAKAAWNTPEGRATAADGTLFMAGAKALIVEEHKIVDGEGLAQ